MADHEPVTWGFIGAGGVARRRMLPAVAALPQVRVGAVMVRDQARAEEIAAEFGAAAAYDRVDRLLADPAVEAVYVATPPRVHAEQVVAAAAAGKHILLEKPMSLSVAECDRMLDAVAAAGVRFAVCFPMRHTAAVAALKDWLEQGELGELTYLRAQMAKWYPLDAAAWRADPEQSGGGVVMDLGSHLLDLAVHLGGPLEQLAAATSRRAWDVPVEDTGALVLRFESGALGLLDMSFAAHYSDNQIEVYGNRGSAVCPAPRERSYVFKVVDGKSQTIELGSVDVYQQELLDFGAAVRENRPAATTGWDGRTNAAWLEAGYRSVASGRFETAVN